MKDEEILAAYQHIFGRHFSAPPAPHMPPSPPRPYERVTILKDTPFFYSRHTQMEVTDA
jgi:hypothetical protein